MSRRCSHPACTEKQEHRYPSMQQNNTEQQRADWTQHGDWRRESKHTFLQYNACRHPTNMLRASPIVSGGPSARSVNIPYVLHHGYIQTLSRKWFHIQHPPQSSCLRWRTLPAADLPDRGSGVMELGAGPDPKRGPVWGRALLSCFIVITVLSSQLFICWKHAWLWHGVVKGAFVSWFDGFHLYLSFKAILFFFFFCFFFSFSVSCSSYFEIPVCKFTVGNTLLEHMTGHNTAWHLS